MKKWIAFLFALALAAAPALAQETAPSCDEQKTYLDCFLRLAGIPEVPPPQQTAEEIATEGDEVVDDSISKKAVPDTPPAVPGSLRDFLPLFFGSLGLGQFSENNGTLTLAFNPKLLGLGPKVSLQALIHEPEVFAPLVAKLPQAVREARKSELGGKLEDFDDVELSLAWNRESERFGRDFRDHRILIAGLYSALVAEARASTGTSAATQIFLQVLVPFRNIISLSDKVGVVRRDRPSEAAQLESALVNAATTLRRTQKSLEELTRSSGFFRLADLINNQPQIHVTGSYRLRGELAGQDEVSGKLTYEHSFVNLNAWKEWCEDERKAADLGCLRAYFPEHEAQLKYSPRLSFTAEYGDADSFDFALPADGFTFHLDEVRKTIASLSYGQYLRLDEAGNQETHFDLDAKWEDVSGDPMRNNRLVATATVTQRLPQDMLASFSLVYGNKPEYRGTVDEELSARLGLRYKLDRKTAAP